MSFLSQTYLIGSYAIPSAVIFLLALAGTGLLYGLVAGRDRVIHVMIALYLSLAIVTNAPIIGVLYRWFQSVQSSTIRLLCFLGVFIFVFFLLWRSHILRAMARERGRFWEAGLFSLLLMGLVVTIVLLLVPREVVDPLPALLKTLFASDIGRSLWLIAPLIALIFTGRPSLEDALDLETA